MDMRSSRRYFEGSMTVEAAFVLPLFIFFFVNIMMLFNITQIQSELEAALHQAGSELSIRAFDLRFGESALGGEGSKGLESIAGAGGVLLARQDMKRTVGERIDKSIVSGGFDGISFLQSKVLLNGDIIDLVLDYKVHPIIPVIGFTEIPVEGRYYGHAWTGYDISGGFAAEDEGEEMVYVTEYGEVYHRDIDCVHLSVRVTSVDYRELSGLRNRSGARYYPCEYCGGHVGAGNVFITEYGNRYHSSASCKGLSRKIYTIPISEVGTRRPCSACG